MQIIKQKLQQGEIKPAVVKQAVQKVDAAPEIKKAEPKVDVKPEVKKVDEPKTTDVVKPFKDSSDGATYSTIAVKSSENNPNVKIYLGKRDGKSGTSYSIYAVDLRSGEGVAIKSGFRTDADDLSTAQSQFAIKDIPLGSRYKLSPGSTQYQRYQLLRDKFDSEINDNKKAEVSKDATAKFIKNGKDAPYKVARFIKRTAFDGDALKFDNWTMKAVSDPADPEGIFLIITGSVNGKNKLGAYVGSKEFMAMIDPDTGEVDKLYMENDPRYAQASALISKFKTNLSTPVSGPSAGKWGLF
jgi:hypothetical protein